MIKKKHILIFVLVLNWLFFPLASAQNTNINGIVKDANDRPLMGAVVKSENGTPLGVTDTEGHFSVLKGKSEDYLTISLLGYKSMNLKAKEGMVVILKDDISKSDEKINLGYTAIPKIDFSGSAVSASSGQLMKAPVSLLSGSFAGNFPGLFVHETSSEVSRESYDMFVRGWSNMHQNSPLVVIDGIPCYPGTEDYSLSYITAGEVESVTILKDAATESIYGTQGANGVIVITTKRGVPGKIKVSGTFDESLNQVSTTPTFISSAEYATLRNEAANNDGLGENYYFSNADIAKYRDGSDRNLYPNTNWRSMLMKDFVQTQRAGFNVSGGNDRVTYFSNFNLLHAGGPWKAESNNKYNANENFYHFNFRTNIDVKIASFLGAYLNVAGNVKKEHYPGAGFMSSIYPHLFTMPSTTYGPVTPTIDGSSYPAGEVIVTQNENDSPYGRINRTGYNNSTVTNIYSDFGLKLNMDFLIQGLSLSGDVSYMSNTVGTLSTTKNYRRYMGDTSSTDLNFTRKGTEDDTNLSYGKSSNERYDLFYRGKLNYVFNSGNHHLNAFAYSFYQRYESNDALPRYHVISGAEADYNYAHRYALTLNSGYSGSDQYSDQSKWTVTPAISAAWILSNEAFMKEVPVISLAKIRVSYGITADDQNGLGRYSYEDDYSLSNGGNISSLQYTLNENSLGNPYLVAEKTKKTNWGLDLGLLNLVNFSLDVYKERLNNGVISSTSLIPSWQGIPLGIYPKINGGKYENKGYEAELSIEKSYNNGFGFNFGTYIAYNKNKVLYTGEVSKGDDYAYPYRTDGFSQGTTFGYLVDYSNGNGFYNFQNEIDAGPTYSFGTPRVGDLKYKDVNGDGIIDTKDQVPITDGSLPRYTYAFSTSLSYKDFDLSILVQGVGKWKSFYSGMGIWDTNYDGIYGALEEHAWTEERWDNGEEITAPALSTKTSTNQQTSDYYVYNRSYLRLKNVEIGYTLPHFLTKKYLGMEKLRIVLSGENLITWDHMKSKDFGPEGSYQSVPVYRVYNIGLRANF
ncbi:MAG: SusC/RagA family TonB-linked outer membrane protein [Prevotella sp.]|nr:SusC/RagA family TonB-linked outer membrane protein [Prevotella sp.]MCI1684438.1 SusC/RagA family TonB-linked outer membrane protein [Prevotella sp.]MCI1781272.1 SusC/RagA family TonB-linked outer membrane protein [Prevotella sp.]MCI1802531.1 SusC/RagA family TonB-linked outer membrane protein [Prevotella sp.]MCI1816958.1 SusC/RagA family TonB-linked outer membrane protein [Prevotella sp.]MCI2179746.1 SusC/RagA family TonB-linked outer membrane protein [Prevotella sp.]